MGIATWKGLWGWLYVYLNLQKRTVGVIRVVCLTTLIVALSQFSQYLASPVMAHPVSTDNPGSLFDFWLFRLSINLLGYATILVPGYLIIQWVRKHKYLDTAGSGFIPNVVRLCVKGSDADKPSLEEGAKDSSTAPTDSTYARYVKLVVCALGLQSFYLIWGVVQEKIMTHKYRLSEADAGENFKDSQFLVFMNRILAFVMGCVVLQLQHSPKHTAPLYKYSYSSFSNIMSSWCQYEALKFVSFPTQVLAKASKVIPVMLMGKLVSQKKFEYYEYVSAIMISLGMTLFLLTSEDSVKDKGTVTTFSGVVLMMGYLAFDSFTSNWQGELFRRHKMSSIQMMVGVNLFSVLFTSVSLIEQGGFFVSGSFMFKYPAFAFHVMILSVCSAAGQILIFYTISQFGAVTFAIIMTLRQGLAILLSCILFHHPITAIGILGVLTIFAAIFMRMYCSQRIKAIKARAALVSIAKEEVPLVVVTNGKS